MGTLRSIERARKKRVDARLNRANLATHGVDVSKTTEDAGALFIEDNPSHDWGLDEDSQEDAVCCSVCGERVTAERMMSERVKLDPCPPTVGAA